MHNALILNYRSLDTGKAASEFGANQAFSVREADFAAQMALLKKLGMPVVSLEELVENDRKRKRWHRHVALITFENGNQTDREIALPILKQYNFPATFFIEVQQQLTADQWEQWRELAAAPGFSLGSLTVSNASLPELPAEEWQRELAASKEIIEAKTGAPAKYLALAGRYHSVMAEAAVAAGFEALLSSKVGVNRFNADLFQLKRWTVRRNTSLVEFEKMLCRDKQTLINNQIRFKVFSSGKKFPGTGSFGKLRNLLFKPKS